MLYQAGHLLKAIILAAGKGTRLGIIGQAVPKVLLPVAGKPIIEYTFDWLKTHGITQVAMNVNNHHGSQVVDWVGDGTRFGMNVCFSAEETLLGTAGGVKRMEHFFDGTFIVVYGDILVDFDLGSMLRFHKEKRAAATIALIEVADPSGFGIVEIQADGRIMKFIEKPAPGTKTGKLANGAIYILEKPVLEHVPCDTFCDFGYDIFPKLLNAGVPMYGYRLTPTDYFMDIGTPEKYHQANSDVTAGRLTRIQGKQRSIAAGG